VLSQKACLRSAGPKERVMPSALVSMSRVVSHLQNLRKALMSCLSVESDRELGLDRDYDPVGLAVADEYVLEAFGLVLIPGKFACQ
jgi:hypothetical protein